MGILPIRESSFRLARLELVARPIDQGSGLAMNASDGIGPKGSDGAKAVQENIVRYRDEYAGQKCRAARFARSRRIPRPSFAPNSLPIPRSCRRRFLRRP